MGGGAALDRLRAWMISAPRFWTRGMNSSRTQAASSSSIAGRPPIVAWFRSGYWVAEWFPRS